MASYQMPSAAKSRASSSLEAPAARRASIALGIATSFSAPPAITSPERSFWFGTTAVHRGPVGVGDRVLDERVLALVVDQRDFDAHRGRLGQVPVERRRRRGGEA